MNRPLRIATFAVPLSGNKGSASMLLGLRDAFDVAATDAEFAVFSYYPRRDAALARKLPNVTVHPGHPKHLAFQLLPLLLLSFLLPCLVPRRWRRHIQALRKADVVLLMGGTTFADSMLYKVPWNVLAALPGYLLRKPTVFVSQTMGPFSKRLNRWAARWTLRRAVEVHGRGRTSAEHVATLGGCNVCYAPDLSCTLKVPSFQRVAAREAEVRDLATQIAAARAAGQAIVGVAPNSIVFDKVASSGGDYIAFLASAIETIRDHGCLPVLIPHSYREELSRLHNNDRAICSLVRASLADPTRCIYLDADLSSADLRAVIGQLDLLVASRFHSMVSALMMGVVPITYGWGDQKYREVLAEFQVEELFVSYRDLARDDFAARFQRVLSRREAYAERISAATPAVVASAWLLPQRLVAVVNRAAAKDWYEPTAADALDDQAALRDVESSLEELQSLVRETAPPSPDDRPVVAARD